MKNPDPRIQASPNLWQKLAPQARRMRQEATPAEELLWQFIGTPEAQFFSGHISGAQRLRGDNVLVTEGTPGSVFELTRQGEVV